MDAQHDRDFREFVKYHKATGHYDYLVKHEKTAQKQWLMQRDACKGDSQCIQKAYQDRLAELNKYTMMCVSDDSADIYKDRSCYKPAKPTEDKCPEDDRIDFNFVSTWEGGQALNAYVPGGYIQDREKSGPVYVYLKPAENRNISASSGVTVDTGVDLAYHKEWKRLRCKIPRQRKADTGSDQRWLTKQGFGLLEMGRTGEENDY